MTFEPGQLTIPAVAPLLNVTDMTNDWEVTGGLIVGLTIMRIHMRIMFKPTALTTIYNVGIIVGRQTDVPSSSYPHPDPGNVSDRDLSWMLNDRFYPVESGGTVDGATVQSWDLKARRRLRTIDDRLFLAVSGPASAAYIPYARVLVALP